MERAIGDLDEFQIVRPLGKGGMGEVYLGHDTVLDRAVAIKLIAAGARDERSRERFLIEARAIARLSHPNVVTIFRVGTAADGRPFLVQELIRGRSLDQVPRPMPWRQVCELGIGIARGLEAAHRRGIFHRDVKPANVMLDENGVARLLDFGLAKLGELAPTSPVPDVATHEDLAVAVTRGAANDVAVTRDALPIMRTVPRGSPVPLETVPGAVIGTPRYTAPESWRGEPSTVRSDLYSLGGLLYELLANTPPYPETDLDELRRCVLAGGAPSVRERAPDTHPGLADVVMRCLALDPEARPVSAAEVAHALERVLVPAPSVPDGNPYRGLRTFDAAHRALFFGRGSDVSVLVDRLRTEPIVVVVGDSGIGKSSVCHAGVVPVVQAGGLGDRRTWRVVPVALGRLPWTALCDALGVAPGELDARALRPPPDAGLLLVIDQLEELVTLGDPDEAARVADLLASIADGTPGVKALLAVRGDFLTRVAALPELGTPLTHGLHLLRVLSRDDLRDAIVGPARAKGVHFERDAMVDELVAAVVHNPGALPLLQFTLAELWQARDVEPGVIRESALAELGGVDGALARHADRVLLELGAPERAAARSIVLRLVGEHRTRAVRSRDELAGDDPVATAALESLVRGRLVVARDTVAGTPSYELAHEALIRSWNTLRDWLDAAAGEVAARNRLIASASEWHRLERKPDLLWSRRQLDEVRALDLSPTEHLFVAASHAQLRRRRLVRIASIAALPVLAAAIYGGVRFDAARTRDREVGARVAAAANHRATADVHARAAADARARAFALFDADATPEGERMWADARARAADADAGYRLAARELEGAFLVEAGSVRKPMASVLWAHAELAEATHQHARVAELLQRLAAYDEALHARWNTPAHVTIDVDTPATLAVHPASPTGGFEAQPLISGPRVDATLPAGSYLVIATTADGRAVRLPILLARGERVREAITIPRTWPAGYVYIPAGRFLYGSSRDDAYRREFLRTPPLHAIRRDAFLIARTELTFGDWIEYLRALPPEERAKHLPRAEGHERAVRLEEKNGRFVLSISPSTTWSHAAEGEPLTYAHRTERQTVRWERLPVVGITIESVEAYAAWLDRSGRVRGARLCTIREWERAARGADGRSYPHGEVLLPTHANHDATYNGVGYGLDEVGTWPASDSPFGIADLAGNAAEMIVRGGPDPLAIKGGSFFQSAVTALSSNTSKMTRTLTNVVLGVRLCADPER